MLAHSTQVIVLQLCLNAAFASWFSTQTPRVTWARALFRKSALPHCLDWRRDSWDPIPRGGSIESGDEERYSRQVYTLGARAHGLVRRTTVYLDGPMSSGLMYECAKNLALSGVRELIVVIPDNNTDEKYHNNLLDDLGRTYQHGARVEIDSLKGDVSPEELLLQYISRLNPGIATASIKRSMLSSTCANEAFENQNSVYMAIDRPYTTQVATNDLARTHDWPFISVETAGVFGRTFCDFGPSFEVFDSDGETPNVTPLDRVEISGDRLTVHCVAGEKHDVSKGDTIQFRLRNSDTIQELGAVSNVKGPYHFEMELPDSQEPLIKLVDRLNTQTSSFSRVKIPQIVEFLSLEAAYEAAKDDDSYFTACDLEKSFDKTRRSTSMSCFQALSRFVEAHQRIPTLNDMETFSQVAQDVWPSHGGKKGKNQSVSFLHGCSAKFTPLQCIFGAIGSQEVLKAATGLYYPVKQILLYDCDEVLGCNPVSLGSDKCKKDSTQGVDQTRGMRHILGDKLVRKLQKKKVFVVGAGAIGCEILKNLASMGVGSRKGGKVVVTDMDTIEKSNLSRQLLFRDDDIGKFKSVAAQSAANRLNPSMKVETHSSKVGRDSSGPFDEKFWGKEIDVVLNALDNVEARLYMDTQCVDNKKALVDAGTMGPKGNVQVVVPNLSESYSSSVDPPEPAIPVCTLKNFPYAISHTIQWGKDLFDGFYLKRPEQANEFLSSSHTAGIPTFMDRLVREKGPESALLQFHELLEDLVPDRQQGSTLDIGIIRKHALKWAKMQVHKLFYLSTRDLLLKHPLNSRDEDGEPFWAGTRRPPQALKYVLQTEDASLLQVNDMLVEFVRHGARLRVETMVGAFSAPECHFSSTEVRQSYENDSESYDLIDTDAKTKSNDLKQSLLEEKSSNCEKLYPIEFEKDDDSNGHVSFVSSASNLRAIAYGIPPVDEMETRKVAGKIVPAMITTTAFVSAISCIELVKVVQESDLRLHRNAFINLALPFFAFTIPLAAETSPGLDGNEYSLWDKLTIKESGRARDSGGITLRSVLRRIKKLASETPSKVEVTSITCGPYMLYANFLHDEDISMLKSSIWDLVQDAVTSSDDFENAHSRENVDKGRDSDRVLQESFANLIAVVEDTETGEEVELPVIRIERHRD